MSVPRSLRFCVFARDGFVCQYCGEQPPDVVLEVDHIHPKSKGGEDEITNLLTSCFDCNRGKRGTLVPAAIVIAQARIPPRMEPQHPLTLLRFRAIEKRIPVGYSTIKKWIREGKFPEPVILGARTQVWRAAEIDEWIRENA